MCTAEIYSAVENLAAVADSLVIDLPDREGESSLLMFVVPNEGHDLDPALENAMKLAIRTSLSPRFIPDRFIRAPGIPRTLSGKKQELPVKRLFEGRSLGEVCNPDLIANPEVLPWFVAAGKEWLGDNPKLGDEA